MCGRASALLEPQFFLVSSLAWMGLLAALPLAGASLACVPLAEASLAEAELADFPSTRLPALDTCS